MKPDAMKHCIAVQRWYALSQDWNLLKMALMATSEAADKAVAASNQQSALHQAYAHKSIRSGMLRTRQANVCLSAFRYVTILSHYTRVRRQRQESELLAWANLQGHYEEALGPQADLIPSHRRFLDTLGRSIETFKRKQGLKMVCIRWVQLRAATALTQQAKKFHLIRKGLRIREKRADRAFRQADHLQKKMVQCVQEYEHLETEVMNAQRAIQAL